MTLRTLSINLFPVESIRTTLMNQVAVSSGLVKSIAFAFIYSHLLVYSETLLQEVTC